MRRKGFWIAGFVFLAGGLWLTRSEPNALGGASPEAAPETVASAPGEREIRFETSRNLSIGPSDVIAAKSPPHGDRFAEATAANADITSQIREAEYWFAEGVEEMASAPALHGPNRRQAFSSTVSGHGIAVSPFPGTGEDWTFGFALSQPGAVSADREKTTVRSDGGREEWFRNTPEGIEHGMVLPSPPASTDGDLVLKFPIRTDLQPTLIDKDLIVMKNADGATVLRYEKIIVLDANDREVPAELALTGNGSEIAWNIRHQGFAYPLRIDPLITREQPGITDFDGDDFNLYEIQSVAMTDGTLALIGREILYIYGRDSENGWSRLRTVALSSLFGFEINLAELQIEDDILFLCGIGNERSEIVVFDKNPTTEGWGETTRIIASVERAPFERRFKVKDGLLWVTDSFRYIQFYRKDKGGSGNWGRVTNEVGSGSPSEEIRGSLTAIDGDHMAVAERNGSLLELYRRDPNQGNRWQREGQLMFQEIKDLAIVEGQLIVVIDGRHLLSGESFQGNGAVLVHEFTETASRHGLGSWSLVQAFRPCIPNGTNRPLFEATLKVAGGRMAVVVGEDSPYVSLFSQDGASRWHAFEEGIQLDRFGRAPGGNFALTEKAIAFPGILGNAATIIVRDIRESGQRSYLDTDFGLPPDSPGGSPDVALSAEHMIVGFPGDHGTPGAAYIFERRDDVPDAWILRKKLISGEPADSFGKSVKISGDTVAIAAPDAGRSSPGSGKVFVFNRNKGGIGVWGSVKTIVPPFAGNFSEFGGGLALFSGRIAVSAVNEDFPTGSDVIFIFEENLGGSGAWGKRAFIVSGEARSRDGKTTMPALFGDVLAVINPLPTNYGTQGTLSIYREDEGGPAAWGREYLSDRGFQYEPTSLSIWGSRIAVGCSDGFQVETSLFIRGAGGSWEDHPASFFAEGPRPGWGRSVALFCRAFWRYRCDQWHHDRQVCILTQHGPSGRMADRGFRSYRPRRSGSGKLPVG